MNRSRRVSRPLIGILGAVIILGLFFFLHNLKRSRAQEPAHDTAQANASSTADSARTTSAAGSAQPAAFTASAPATQPEVLITQTPGIAPSGSGNDSRHQAQTPSSAPGRQFGASTTQHSDPNSSASGANVTAIDPAASLAEGKSKKEAGDLLTARADLNASLLSGKLNPADAEAARHSIAEINQTVIFSPRKFPDDALGGTYAVLSGERLSTIAAKNGVTWEFLARINGIEPRRLRSGSTIKIIKGPFHVIVSKSLFRMDVYLGSPGEAGSMYVTSFPVGLGKDGSTPTGLWQVEAGNKIRHPKYYSPRGEGVIDADDPKNPLGGYWVGLVGLDGQAVGKNSYGIHGTIDPNSIGKQESMGCIRLRQEDIAQVFDLLVEGKSKILVKD